MKAISVEYVQKSNAGSVVRATLLSDSDPENLPTTGDGIEGMDGTMKFAPMSIIYVVDESASHKLYMANESGVFVGQ